MASFDLRWRTSTKKDLRRLPSREVERVLGEVELLAENPFPHGSEKLAGAEHTYRIRVGNYRVIYMVSTVSRAVEIQRVRHRKDVYRR